MDLTGFYISLIPQIFLSHGKNESVIAYHFNKLKSLFCFFAYASALLI